MPNDRFGIPFFHPSKSGGVHYQFNDPENQSNFEDGGNVDYGSGDEFTMVVDGATSCFVTRNPGFTETADGCDEDHDDNESRGFAHKSTDLRDIEFKCLVSIEGGGDHGFSMSGPTGRHKSNSSPCCGGNAYMITTEFNENPSTFRFRKEIWHVSYHTDPKTGEWTHPLCNFKLNNHGYVGLGYVRYNKPNGRSSGHDSVILECWFNPNPESNIENWTKIKTTEDKGGWGNDGDECGSTKDQVLTWGGVKFRLKSNDESGCEIHMKHVSLREIDPFKSFDVDTPEEPEAPPQQITTLQGSLKLQWDVNNLRVSPCAGTGGGGGGGGSALFYSVPVGEDGFVLSDSATHFNRVAVGEFAVNSSSPLIGKIIKQVDVWLKKVGSPAATPTVSCRLKTSDSTNIYISPTTFAPTTLTSEFVKYTFDLSANTHVMTTGQRVQVEYTGTGASDYVVVGHNTGSVSNAQLYAITESGETFTPVPDSDLSADLWQ